MLNHTYAALAQQCAAQAPPSSIFVSRAKQAKYRSAWILLVGLFGVLPVYGQLSFDLHSISGASLSQRIFTIDLDGDGDQDIVSATGSGIVWYENDGTPVHDPSGWTVHTVDGSFSGAPSLFASDMDGDNDVDIVASTGGNIAWWKNDGTPRDGGWTKFDVHTAGATVASVRVADLDADGKPDIYGADVFANGGQGEVAWWRNTGVDNAWTKINILSSYQGARDVAAVDFDGDTDLDLVTLAEFGNDLLLLTNDGTPINGGWTATVLDDAPPFTVNRVATGDLDNDGNLDVLAVSRGSGLMWWENNGGSGWTRREIATGNVAALAVLDIDFDGDLDVVAGQSDVKLFLNDGSPTDGGWVESTIDSSVGVTDVRPVDLNGDGRWDVASGTSNSGGDSGTVRWVRGTLPSLTVRNTNDSGIGSLRRVLIDAPPDMLIVFDNALNGETITLSSGDMALNKNVTIDASALGSGLTLDANNTSRMFDIASGTTVTIKSLTFRDGLVVGTEGGAIRNAGTLTLDGSTLDSNQAGDGGGIFNSGTLTITASTLTDNAASASGGGVANAGTLTITNSTLSANRAEVNGGGVSTIVGTATLTGSTLSGNTATSSGGGLYNTGTATLTQVTVSGNAGNTSGGGVTNTGTLSLVSTTINANTSPLGGGVRNTGGATLNLNSSIIAGSTSGGDCSNAGNLGTLGHMLIEDGSCTPTVTGSAGLGALANNGGTTQTHVPLPGSAVLDVGVCNSLATDQRGQTRPVDIAGVTNTVDGCDLGAVEATAAEVSVHVTNTNDDGAGSLRNLVATAASGALITFDASLNGQTITLTSGSLRIDKDITVDASALANGVTVSGGSAHRTLEVEAAQTVVLKRLTLTGGTNETIAGAVSNLGTLTLEEVTVSGSTAPVAAGIFNGATGTLTVRRSLITNNTASNGAGGLLNSGTLFVENSTITGNTAPNGGGGLFNSGTGTVTNSTLFGNSSTSAGGANLFNDGTSSAGLIHLRSTVLGGALAGPDCANSGTISTMSRTLIQDGTCSPNLTGNPMLGALADNGGPTLTLLPQTGSPLIDAGSCNGLATDQRGQRRAVDEAGVANADDGCDIGATEGLQNSLPVELSHFAILRNGEALLLAWETASETNNAGFEVEQAYANEPWQTIHFVEGHGTTPEVHAYQYSLGALEPGVYRFRLRQVDFDGAFSYSPVVEAVVEVPQVLHLAPAYPNPFNPQTTLAFAVPYDGVAQLTVYDLLGREVARVFNGHVQAGQVTQARFEADGLASGTYLYQLHFEGQTKVGRMVLMK